MYANKSFCLISSSLSALYYLSVVIYNFYLPGSYEIHFTDVFFTLKLLRGNLNKVRETDPLLFKGIAVAVKIGFPDVIMPGNKMYVESHRIICFDV